jgi:hypothetical protein
VVASVWLEGERPRGRGALLVEATYDGRPASRWPPPAPLAGAGARNLSRFFQVPPPERIARLRELRVAALLWLGSQHPLVRALVDAIADPEAIAEAVAQIDALPAILRRRILAVMAVA